MKVLIADDESSTIQLLKKLTQSWGYQTVIARDGNEALDCLRGGDPPQIALLDWFMPGKTGIDICTICENENLPVYRILITSQAQNEDLMHALDNGAHDFQSKPVVPGVLKSRLAVASRSIQGIQDVIRSERLAAIGELVAGVAHNFNNLNTPILMYASSILTSTELAPNLRQKLEKIENAAEKAGELTEKLMAIADNTNTRKKDIDLNVLITDILAIESIIFEENNIRVETDLQPVSTLFVNESDIQNIVMNLLKNACDALRESREKKIRIKTHEKDKHVYMALSDTGCGIPPENLKRVFSLFYTKKGEFAEKHSPLSQVKGTGIGLYASKKTAASYGGNITVESRIDMGTTFTFRCPVHSKIKAT